MVSVVSHAVVAKNEQSGMTVHFIDNTMDDLIRIPYFPLEFLVKGADGVTCGVDADYVADHQFKITAIVKLF